MQIEKETADGNSMMSVEEIKQKIWDLGLRPTKQRMAVADCIFRFGQRHFSVEEIHHALVKDSGAISLATVYNTIKKFSDIGLIRELHIDGTKSLYDNNLSPHHHIYDQETGNISDIPFKINLKDLPAPPEGREIDRVDITIHLKKINPLG
jgi:Fur family iron response transcriptional regulator